MTTPYTSLDVLTALVVGALIAGSLSGLIALVLWPAPRRQVAEERWVCACREPMSDDEWQALLDGIDAREEAP